MHLPEPLQSLAIHLIGERVRAMTGSTSSPADFAVPQGDPGLFGPQSMTWRVHAHFTAMMVGGLSSLIVQSLHSRALAAVWDHSNFRHQLKARLGRTAYFVAATTYGSQSLAMGCIHKVNAIHARVTGVDLQGQPYVANEPDLIKWVHLVEVDSFLSAYQHLSKAPLTAEQCDQYVAEMSRVGHLLGAHELPETRSMLHAQLQTYQGALVFDDRARDILDVIESYPTDWFDKPFMTLVLQSAMAIIPPWALSVMGREPACVLQQHTTRLALQCVAEPVQWMLDKQGVASIARQRVMG